MSQVKLQDGRFSTEDKINHLAELAFVLCPDCTEKFRLIVKREQNIKEEAGRQPAPSANAVDDSDNRHTQPTKAGYMLQCQIATTNDLRLTKRLLQEPLAQVVSAT